jgi:hypothetical protein
MIYSRQSPSGRYQELLQQYSTLHADGDRKRGLAAEQTYAGISLFRQCAGIRELIQQTGASTILDYGCGKGIAYDLSPIDIPGEGRVESLLDYWDVDSVHCFDPCYPPYANLPQGRFGGVICTDVLEHCPEDDLGWIVRELFSFADRFVFANVACYSALAHLPNGENAHLTIRDPQWWEALFATTAKTYPDVGWRILTDSMQAEMPTRTITVRRFGTL